MQVLKRSALLCLFGIGAVLAGCAPSSDDAKVDGAPARIERAKSAADLPPYERIDPHIIGAMGFYAHPWSGVQLPEQAGRFKRVRLVQFDKAALDITAEYQFATPDGLALANVYIYPMTLISPLGADAGPQECRREFDGIKTVLRQRFPDAVLVREWSPEPLEVGSPMPAGLAVAYDFTSDLLGAEMPVRSEAFLFCHVDGLWAIKYRVTYPRAQDLTEAIGRLMFMTSQRSRGPWVCESC